MTGKKTIVFYLLLAAAWTGTAAQSLRGLTENPVIREYNRDHPYRLKAATADTLSLPFFEDFSTSSVVPDPALWTDRYAYINNSFAFEPISLGVATLDAIDENGEVYPTLSNLPVGSDSLTSKPIDLLPFVTGTDTVHLSFYYQAGGTGEIPERRDSLVVDFYSPASGKWRKAWYAITDTFSHFSQVILDVPKTYCQKGFRFRFRNYTSLSPAEVSGGQGALSNVDCWNIDYIMLNALPAASHRFVNDVTQVVPPRGLMSFYESIPWLHLNEAQAQLITRKFLHYRIRNLSSDSVNVERTFFTHDLNTGEYLYDELHNSGYGPASFNQQNDEFSIPFTRPDDSPSGAIEVVAGSKLLNEQYKPNDTARTTLYFKDYYAYDDGSPEYGFGLSGESAAGAMLALRFRIYKPDTLRGLEMLFNKTRDHFNESLTFKIAAWKDVDGVPGDLIYMSEEDFSPKETEGKMPGMNPYLFPKDTDVVITDTSVFVGWKQNSEEFLNLGYDVNRDNLPRTFANITGAWFNPGNSLIPGTVMIRAVFGKKDVMTGEKEIPGKKPEVEIYPNPASGIVHINANGFRVSRIRMLDLQGRVVLEESGSRQEVDVSRFPAGLYFIQLGAEDGTRVNRKIIIRH